MSTFKFARESAESMALREIMRTPNPDTLSIGVYRSASTTKYVSFVGPRAAFTPDLGTSALISLQRLPPAWIESMQMHILLSDHRLPLTELGLITIGISLSGERATARTDVYSPKLWLNRTGITVLGLGYKTEMIVLESLVGEVTHVRTTGSPSYARSQQLLNVGLAVNTETPIDQWLEGLRRGLRSSLRKQRAVNVRNRRHEPAHKSL
ncbi:MAG: hypothetical protein KGH72_00985 [Candidatus Micrarchaeota archaeon]|nr:hypothetical protein [Candidatus Micrarchaeota archaeon]